MTQLLRSSERESDAREALGSKDGGAAAAVPPGGLTPGAVMHDTVEARAPPGPSTYAPSGSSHARNTGSGGSGANEVPPAEAPLDVAAAVGTRADAPADGPPAGPTAGPLAPVPAPALSPAPRLATPMAPTSLFPPFFEGGDGGTVSVRVSATDVGRDDIFPTCRISVGGDNLHAPLIERLFELPMDVYEGRLNGNLEICLKTKDEWTRFPRFGGNVDVSNAAFHFWDSPDDFSGTDLDLSFDDSTCHIVSSRGRFGAAEVAATGTVGMNPETGEYDISADVSPTDVNAVRATLGARPLPYPAAGAVKGQFTCYGALENPIFSGKLKTVREGAWGGTPPEGASDAQKALEDARRAGDDVHVAYDKLAITCANSSFLLSLLMMAAAKKGEREHEPPKYLTG